MYILPITIVLTEQVVEYQLAEYFCIYVPFISCVLPLITLASYLDSDLYLYVRKYPHDAMCVNKERKGRS